MATNAKGGVPRGFSNNSRLFTRSSMNGHLPPGNSVVNSFLLRFPQLGSVNLYPNSQSTAADPQRYLYEGNTGTGGYSYYVPYHAAVLARQQYNRMSALLPDAQTQIHTLRPGRTWITRTSSGSLSNVIEGWTLAQVISDPVVDPPAGSPYTDGSGNPAYTSGGTHDSEAIALTQPLAENAVALFDALVPKDTPVFGIGADTNRDLIPDPTPGGGVALQGDCATMGEAEIVAAVAEYFHFDPDTGADL